MYSQPGPENTVFHSQLIESTDVKPRGLTAYLMKKKNWLINGPAQFKPMLFNG